MKLTILIMTIFLGQCAFPHKYTLGDIDNTSSGRKPFKIMLSERGYDFGEGVTIAQAGLYLANKEGNVEAIRDLQYVKLVLDLMTMGPVTGRKVFNSKYADNLTEIIFQHCKSGKFVNLRQYRESAVYPVVSGEIIRIQGDCLD